jgi:hypothetical protein
MFFNDLRFQNFRVVEDNDANGHVRQTHPLRGAIAPRPQNDFVMAIHFPREKRREDTLATDAFGKFLQLLFIKSVRGTLTYSCNDFTASFVFISFSPFFDFLRFSILFG